MPKGLKININVEGTEQLKEFIKAIEDLEKAINRLTTLTTAIGKIEVGLKEER